MIAVTDEQIFLRHIDLGDKVSIPWKVVAWFLAGCAVLVASRVYYIEEMVAALVLFAVLFSCIAAVALLLIVLGRGGEAILGFVEWHAKNLLSQVSAPRKFSEPQSRI